MPYTPVECRAKVARLHALEKIFLLHCRMQLFPALPEVVRGMFRRPEALAVCPPGGDPRERGMFLNQTANYGLSQWEATDRILMENFNSDNTKTDAALKENADNIAALETAVALCGNCKIVYGSYTGTGTYGSEHPNTLAFDQMPILVLVQDPTENREFDRKLRMMRGVNWAVGTDGNYVWENDVTWTEKGVRWSSETSAETQFNVSGRQYRYLALLVMDE